MVLTREAMPTTPSEARMLFREGSWTQDTLGICNGYTNANLVIVPRDLAYDFLLFCQRNPKPCPVLEVLDEGDPTVRVLADGADIRSDLPRYRVFVRGELVDEPTEIGEYWRSDLVTFLFGCSGTFASALDNAGIKVRLGIDGENPGFGVYRTNIPTVPAGRLRGPMVVSMRGVRSDLVSRAVVVTSRFPNHHGSPVHVGDPGAIGITDLSTPDWGAGPVELLPDEVPVFWACGVTPQDVALESKPDLMITHSPIHMFISDIPSEQQASS